MMRPSLNAIIQGDTLDVLKTWPDEFVDCVITSPPYWGLRNYGAEGQIGLESTFQEYLDRMMLIFAELKRVLKPTGSLWLNMGDAYASAGKSGGDFGQEGQTKISQSYQGRGRCNEYPEKSLIGQPWRMALRMIDEQGWILRSDIKWIKQILIYKERRTMGSVMPTSVKDRFNNAGEYLFHFVKNKKYYFDLDAVRLKPQTMENRPPGIDREKEYPNVKRNNFAFNYHVRDAVKKQGQPQFVASEEEIGKYNKNPDPRGNEKGGPGSYRLWKDKHPNYKQVPENYGKKKLTGIEDEKLGNRWMSGTPNFTRGDDRAVEAKKEGMHTFYTHSKRFKPGEYQKEHGLPANYLGPTGTDHNLLNNPNGKNIPNAWLIGTEPQKDAHFAMYPTALCEIPIKSSCPPDGLVLDSFMGGGSTAVAAKRLKRNWLGIELNPAYIEIARKRINSFPEPMF